MELMEVMKLIGSLTFRPLSEPDYDAWGGAGLDAVIAENDKYIVIMDTDDGLLRISVMDVDNAENEVNYELRRVA